MGTDPPSRTLRIAPCQSLVAFFSSLPDTQLNLCFRLFSESSVCVCVFLQFFSLLCQYKKRCAKVPCTVCVGNRHAGESSTHLFHYQYRHKIFIAQQRHFLSVYLFSHVYPLRRFSAMCKEMGGEQICCHIILTYTSTDTRRHTQWKELSFSTDIALPLPACTSPPAHLHFLNFLSSLSTLPLRADLCVSALSTAD